MILIKCKGQFIRKTRSNVTGTMTPDYTIKGILTKNKDIARQYKTVGSARIAIATYSYMHPGVKFKIKEY